MKDEILRYLAYKNQKIDSHMDKLIDEAMDEISSLAKERYTYRSFIINEDNNSIFLDGSELKLYGNDIRNHLSKSKECILIAATLGHQVDTRIRYYEKVSMTRALILDACATATIEALCDKTCKEIDEKLDKKDRTITHRYSPGYGDLPIHIQGDFLTALDARKSIGLTATSTSILIPRKSVTAIVGIVEKDQIIHKNQCENCNKYNKCNYKRGGKGCEY